MQSFTKDTMFTDLPDEIKQKIIRIRGLSALQSAHYTPTPLKHFKYISIPTIKKISSDFAELCKKTHNLRHQDVTEELRNQINEFSEFVDAYRLNINNLDFVAELEKTIALMECKFEKILKKINK